MSIRELLAQSSKKRHHQSLDVGSGEDQDVSQVMKRSTKASGKRLDSIFRHKDLPSPASDGNVDDSYPEIIDLTSDIDDGNQSNISDDITYYNSEFHDAVDVELVSDDDLERTNFDTSVNPSKPDKSDSNSVSDGNDSKIDEIVEIDSTVKSTGNLDVDANDVVDDDYDDDDLEIIEPEKAATIEAFRNKSVSRQLRNAGEVGTQPIIHGVNGTISDVESQREQERLYRIRALQDERNHHFQNINTIREKMVVVENRIRQLSRFDHPTPNIVAVLTNDKRDLSHSVDLINSGLYRIREIEKTISSLKFDSERNNPDQVQHPSLSSNQAIHQNQMNQNQPQSSSIPNVHNSAYPASLSQEAPPQGNSGVSIINGITNLASQALNGIGNSIKNEMNQAYGIFNPNNFINNDASNENTNLSQIGIQNPYLSQSTSTENIDIRDLINNIVDEEVEEEDLPITPPQMSVLLLKHQRKGLSWLLRMEESKIKGGILADDMGLGKTIQALALILANKSNDEERKTTLIVAPVSLLRQWNKEMVDKVKKQHQLLVGIYHGSNKNAMKTSEAMCKYDVVLTSYGTISSEHSKHGEKIRGDYFYSVFYTTKFYRVILDEAQFIKNRNTKASKAVDDIESIYRLCLTGTPMQNNVDELYPIIRFLKAKPYNDLYKFNSAISGPIKLKRNTSQERGMERLQAVLKALLLRRTKDSLIDGKPIFELPEKHIHAEKMVMDKEEFELYQAIETRTGKKAARILNNDGYSWSHILVLLTRLRQACLHTFLCELGTVESSLRFKMDNWRVLLENVMDLDPVTVTKIKQEITEGGFLLEDLDDIDKVIDNELELIDDKIIEPVTELLLEGPPESTNKQLIDEDNVKVEKDVNDEVKAEVKYEEVKYSSTKTILENPIEGVLEQVGKSEISEVDKKMLKESVNDQFKTNEENVSFTCPICVMPANWASILRFPCGHKICDVCVQEFFTSSEEGEDDKLKARCRECTQMVELTDVIDYSIFSKRYIENNSRREIKEKLMNHYSDKMSNDQKIMKLAEKHDGLDPSTKMYKIIELVKEIFEKFPGEKIIIFSQFTAFFDLLKILLATSNIPFLRYDGSMSVDKKDAAVGTFYQDDSVKVMLTSLKAGNAGLTLTCASHIILCDPFWNPFVEDQAMGRAHRLGQTREVHVHRVLLENTVEERIIKLQEEKKEIIEAALDEKGIQNISKLGRRELNFLFGLGQL